MKLTALKFQELQTFQSSTVGTDGTLETPGTFITMNLLVIEYAK
jgi:hypothetical protein